MIWFCNLFIRNVPNSEDCSRNVSCELNYLSSFVFGFFLFVYFCFLSCFVCLFLLFFVFFGEWEGRKGFFLLLLCFLFAFLCFCFLFFDFLGVFLGFFYDNRELSNVYFCYIKLSYLFFEEDIITILGVRCLTINIVITEHLSSKYLFLVGFFNEFSYFILFFYNEK